MAPTNPGKALMLSLKSTKEKLNINKEPVVIDIIMNKLDVTMTAIVPKAKQR